MVWVEGKGVAASSGGALGGEGGGGSIEFVAMDVAGDGTAAAVGEGASAATGTGAAAGVAVAPPLTRSCGSLSVAAGGATLCWRNVGFEVTVKGGGRKAILRDISGVARPGCVLFLMGPSGAGKSSLLDALADRVKLPVTGGVTVDGVPKDELSFKRVAKYVQQQDTLAAALSTRETLLYYSRLCCPWDEAEARSRADSALELLGLRDQANTYIGGALFRGLSGGQKRRVSVGVQLVFQPRVLFLDEPTSGLDSAAAHHVVTGLQKVAKQVGTTTILTIHQPSEKVYGLADGLLLLSSGRMAYFGRADAAVDHFRGISGGDVPPLTSGAEWMLDLVDTSFQEHESVAKVLKAWPESEKARELDGYLSTGAGDELDEALEESARRGFQAGLLDLLTKGSAGDVGLLWQVVVLTRLTFVNVMRNPAYMWLRYAMYIALSVMIGTVWLDIGSSADDIIDVVNVLFFIAAFMVFMSISVLPAYLDDRNIFTKDRANGAYGTLSFLLAQSIVSQPFLFLMSIICSSITYWLIGLNSNVGNFFFFVWNLYISFAVAEAIMLLIASVVPFFVVGIAVGAFLFGTFMVVQGFFIQLDKIGWWWRWLHWVAMHSYSFASFMVNEFAGSTWSCPSETEQASEGLSFCQPGQSSVSGKQVLEFYQIDPGTPGQDRWGNSGVLVGMAIGFTAIAGVWKWLFHTGKK